MNGNQGHPRALYTLFFTEMWERLSYYGMRALLILFMVAPTAKGGLGLDDKVAAAIYGLYAAGVYLSALPGGWIADRLLGAQRAIWAGGILITIGHFTIAAPWRETFSSASSSSWSAPACSSRTSAHSLASFIPRAARGVMRGSRSSTWASTSARSSDRKSVV